MVNVLPPPPELELSQQPRTQVDAGVFNRPLKVDIGSDVQQLGAGTENLATDLAKTQAQDDLSKAVTLDANGQPQVATPQNSIMLGRAGEAYQAAIQSGTKAAATSQVTDTLTGMHQQFQTDPAGFQAASNAYAESLRSKYPGEIGNALADQAQNQAAAHHANLVEQGATRQVNLDLQTITTQIGDAKNQMLALARQGAVDTPAYDKLQDTLQDNYEALGSNPLFGYSKDKIASELNNAMSDLQAQQTVGQVDREFTRAGGGRASAQKMLEDNILNNPDLSISDGERKQAYSWGMARLSYLSGEQKAQVDANRDTVNTTIETLRKNPNAIPGPILDNIITHARSIGDAEGAEHIEGVRAQAFAQKPLAVLTDEQRFNAMSGGGGGNYYGNLRQQESGGNDQAQAGTSSAGGRYGFTTGTWSMLMRQHPELGLTAEGRLDPAQQEKAIPVFTRDNQQQLQRAGISPTDANTYMAHFLGTGGAEIFLKSMAANPAAPAASLLPDAAASNKTVFYNADGTPRSLSEVYALQTKRFGGVSTQVASANGMPFTPQQMAANPFLASEYVHSIATNEANISALGKSIGEGLETSIRGGIAPNPTTLANFLQLAQQYPDKFGEQAQKIQTTIGGQQFAAAADGGAPGTGQAILEEAKRQSQGTSIFQSQIALNALASHKQQAEALKSDPYGEGVRREWLQRPVTPMDFTQPDSLPAAIRDRGAAATIIGSRTGQTQPVLPPTDAQQFAQGMPMLDGAHVQQTLGSIAALPPAQIDQMLGDKTITSAIMGAAHSGDPVKMNAAYSFLDAQYRRNPLQFDASNSAELKDLRAWQALSTILPPDALAKKMATAADPDVIKAKEGLEKQADKDLEALTPDNAVKQVYGGWLPFSTPGQIASDNAPGNSAGMGGAVLAQDYRQAYKDMFAEGVGKDAADAYAREKVNNKYGVSAVNGGRVMAYAPDRLNPDGTTGAYYPLVNGSHDYIHEQLRTDIQATPFFHELQLSNPGEARSVSRGQDTFLLSDDQTQADIAAKRAPSYRVLVQGGDGRLHAVQDQGGTFFRFHADPKLPQAQAETANLQTRQNMADLRTNATSGQDPNLP